MRLEGIEDQSLLREVFGVFKDEEDFDKMRECCRILLGMSPENTDIVH